MIMLTMFQVAGAPQGRHTPLKNALGQAYAVRCIDIPEVELMRKRAFVRLASPSMLSVPRKEVLIVLTGLD